MTRPNSRTVYKTLARGRFGSLWGPRMAITIRLPLSIFPVPYPSPPTSDGEPAVEFEDMPIEDAAAYKTWVDWHDNYVHGRAERCGPVLDAVLQLRRALAKTAGATARGSYVYYTFLVHPRVSRRFAAALARVFRLAIKNNTEIKLLRGGP